jgi:hypothetical protein
MLFGTKKQPVQDDTITLLQRTARIEEKVRAIDTRLLDLEVSFDTLRNKVLRKIQTRNKEPEEYEEPEYESGRPLYIRNR